MEQVYNLEEICVYLTHEIDREEISAHIRHQCEAIVEHFQRYQYCLFSGHDIPSELILQAYESSYEFFHLSNEEKSHCLSKDRARRGYSPENTENFASLIGDTQKPNDLVEKYRIGPVATIRSGDDDYYSSKEGRIYFYPNTWPSSLSTFEPVISSYYQAIERFSLLIIRIIEIGMNLPKNIFSSQFDKHTSILSMNHYRGINDDPASFEDRKISSDRIIRVAKHKDVSMITVVSQCSRIGNDFVSCDSSLGGLDLLVDDPYRCEGSYWHPISESYSTLIVHIGDCLEDWTKGRFKSVSHRVTSNIGASGIERYSLAYFASPNHNAVMVFPDSESALPENDYSITYAQWRKQHIKKACSIQKQNTV